VTFDNRGIDGYTWTPDARSLVVSSTRAGGMHSLWRFPISGAAPVRLTQPGIAAIQPAASAKGRRLAYVSVINDTNIWQVAATLGSRPRLLISSTLLDSSPQFSPGGSRIAFRSNRSGSDEIWLANADGTNQREVTHFNGPLTGSPRWSPDGSRLAFDSRGSGNSDIYILDLTRGTPVRFTTGPSGDVVPSWSRDGKTIYFACNRTGTWQVWKQAVDGGTPQQVTRNGGFMAFESADGRWLFYNKDLPKPSIWRIPTAGGEETRMVDDLKTEMWGNWAVGAKGLYFLDYRPNLKPETAGIEFLNFATNSVREIGHTTQKPTPWNTGLAVSPDERRILFTQIDRAGSDIMLAEGLR
jgi:Tol biopolymer transport system component